MNWQDEVLGRMLQNNKGLNQLRRRWNQAPSAMPPRLKNDTLGAMGNKILQVSSLPKGAISIGGICSLFTGDTDFMYQGRLPNGSQITSVDQLIDWIWSNLPRLDQVHDTIGAPGFYIVEDSLFGERLAARLDRPEWATTLQETIKKHHREQVAPVIQKWHSLIGGLDKTSFTFTSELKIEIASGVASLERYLERSLVSLKYAPVTMMYTWVWPEILKSQGLIPSSNVVIYEPYHHFILMPEEAMYFQSLFWQHQYCEEGLHKNVGIAGFLPAWSYEGSTRQKPVHEVITWGNWRQKLVELRGSLNNFSFPINQNRIVWSAVNYLFWNDQIRDILLDLVRLEDTYQEGRSSLRFDHRPSPNEIDQARKRSEKMKSQFEELAHPFLDNIMKTLEKTVTFLFTGT